MDYNFIGFGTNAGSFTDKATGKKVEYNTDVVVVQGTDQETGFKQVKTFKLSRGFNKTSHPFGQRVTFLFDEWGKVTELRTK